MKPKIILIDALNARSGGAVVIAHETSKALSKIKNSTDKVILVQLDDKLNLKSDLGNVERIFIDKSNYSYLFLLKWQIYILPKIIKKYNVTHVIGLSGFLFRKYKFKKITKILCINNALPFVDKMELKSLFPEYKYRVKWLVLKILYSYSIRLADKVLLSSNYMKELIISSGRANSKKIIVSLTGHNENLKTAFNDESHQLTPLPVLLYLSPIWKYKNHIVIIKAIAELKRKYNQDYKVVFAGGECQKNIVRDLKDLAIKSGVSQSIEFVGNVDRSERDTLLLTSDILLYSSYYEANSVILSEYMSVGKPIVCSDSSSNKEVLKDSALYFMPDDFKELADRINILLINDELKCKLKYNAYRRINELTWTNYAMKLWGEL